MSPIDQRRFPRYQAELPVAFSLGEVLASESAYLNNISAGGVSFNSMVELAPGTVILLQLPPGRPVIRTPARVAWCRKMAFQYAVGAEFLSDDPALRQRIVDMVRNIEDYRREAGRAGRALSSQEATLEWIRLYGPAFFGQE
jgi:hypothetical protein